MSFNYINKKPEIVSEKALPIIATTPKEKTNFKYVQDFNEIKL